MPVGVRPRRKGESGKPFKIVALVGGKPTGAVEGEARTRRDAEISANIRNREARKSAGPPLVVRHQPRLVLEDLSKATARTSKDRGHDHSLRLPATPEAGTYTTGAARTPGASRSHVHVFTVRPGSRDGQVVASSPGVDGHVHRIRLGEERTLRRATTENTPLRKESLETRSRKKAPTGKAAGGKGRKAAKVTEEGPALRVSVEATGAAGLKVELKAPARMAAGDAEDAQRMRHENGPRLIAAERDRTKRAAEQGSRDKAAMRDRKSAGSKDRKAAGKRYA